jgi:rhodanese-related sulfurtransferase
MGKPMETSVPGVTVESLTELLASGRPVRVLDVRRAPAFEKSPKVIPGAERVLPDQVRLWGERAQDKSVPVIAYCVHGHEVSQGAAAELISRGFNASFLVGGVSEWESRGNVVRAVDA